MTAYCNVSFQSQRSTFADHDRKKPNRNARREWRYRGFLTQSHRGSISIVRSPNTKTASLHMSQFQQTRSRILCCELVILHQGHGCTWQRILCRYVFQECFQLLLVRQYHTPSHDDQRKKTCNPGCLST